MNTRNISSELIAALSDTPVVFLAGARQTGKSTLVKSITENGYNATYYTLDDSAVYSAAKADPDGFIAGLQTKVIIDEIQRVPELFLAIKSSIDKKRDAGRFLLTGSANIMVIPKISDSLAGRIDIQTLWPFSQGELQNKKESFIDTIFNNEIPSLAKTFSRNDSLWDNVANGGYPEALTRLSSNRKDAWFRNYIATILQRDIKEISQIDGLTIMPDMLKLIAARTSGLLNFADISRSIQIPQTSMKRYFALLESVFLIHRINPWSKNFNSRLTKSCKIHLNDTGLISYLLGVNASRLKTDRTLAGQLLETFVVNEIVKQISWSQFKPDIFHFRTIAGKEVDIVLEDPQGRCVAIEVKAASTVLPKDIDGIKLFQESVGEKFVRGIVLYTGTEVIPFQKSIHAIPVSALWEN